MKIEEFRAQLEAEFSWRQEEILFFQNQCENVRESQKDKFRRALVLLLYSHFEGFIKFALVQYISFVNNENIDCKSANSAIAAASLADVLAALRHSSKKAPEFKNSAPDDTKLHLFFRDREFVIQAFDLLGRTVNIPDSVVDTESNLKPDVLRKNLYRLGLPYDQFKALDTTINKLLMWRNKIAHGESQQGIEVTLYEELKTASFKIMNEITRELTVAVDEKHYLAQVV